MAKKKRKKSGKNGFAAFGKFLKGLTSLSLKAFPSVIIVAGLAMLFLGVRQALYADPHLSIQQIVVEPPDALSMARRKELEDRLLGKNILRTDLQKIADELEFNPDIKYARVIRQVPSRLRIEIENRIPMALIRFSPRGSYGLVSDDGMILDVTREKNASLLLVEIFGAGSKEPRFGDKIDNPGFGETIKFVKAFWEHPLARYETVSRINLDSFGNVTATLGTGPDVRLGRKPAERLPALEKIAHLLDAQDRNQLDYIDLQFDSVIVKRKR